MARKCQINGKTLNLMFLALARFFSPTTLKWSPRSLISKSKKTRQESKEVNFIRPRPHASGYFWNPRNFLSGVKSFRVKMYPYSNRICPSTHLSPYSLSVGQLICIQRSSFHGKILSPIFFNDCFTDKIVPTSTNSLVYDVQFVCPTYSYFEKGCRKKCARNHSEK